MSKQLHLIDTSTGPVSAAWRLDDRTRQIGRKGIAAARQALQSSHPSYTPPNTQAA